MFTGFEFSEEEDEEKTEAPVRKQTAAEAVVEILQKPKVQQKQATLDQELLEAEMRLEVANFYKAVIKGGFFDNNNSDAARLVEKEMSTFARERLAVLLGMKSEKEASPAPVQAQFNKEELQVLKALILAATRQPTLLVEAPNKKEPSLKKTRSPVNEKVENKVQESLVSKVKSIKNEIKSPAKTQHTEEKSQTQANDGDTFFDEDGKQYKWVINPNNGARVKISVSTQVKNPGAKPMPTPREAEMVSRMKAEESVNAAFSNNGLMGLAAAKIISE